MTDHRIADADPPGAVRQRQRLVVGISGASAPHLAIHLLSAIRKLGSVDTHLVISRAAKRTIEIESGRRAREIAALATEYHRSDDIAAAIASGSFQTMGMVVVPCSMKTLAGIAHGFSDTLLTRAADVCLKERRRLVLVARETPLSLVHLRNMVAVTEAGATVLPPMPAFYHTPDTIEDLLDHWSGKVLDQFGIDHDLYRRWAGVPVQPGTVGGAQR
ncbi:2,5-furandicarboxylate decarboxylase 2 [Murinocardiopsis flavida]|uniref:Flavin prenyltransferase UbiX n=1 Tax=Murinocardiopsis flavida TaxID=645275 RepID=A0A2P8DKT9_9ACTN|nr:UbiX family flavin prenyltransferase [Murinocardiopsis flavida]PSK97836.1 2,5-furandicarboxylate decarboxylase 2 [Murinocardiopsis flavida]